MNEIGDNTLRVHDRIFMPAVNRSVNLNSLSDRKKVGQGLPILKRNMP